MFSKHLSFETLQFFLEPSKETTFYRATFVNHSGSESLFGASISKRHGIFYTEALVDLNMLYVTWEDGSRKQWSCFAQYLYVDTTSVDRLGGDVIDLVRAMWETLWFE